MTEQRKLTWEELADQRKELLEALEGIFLFFPQQGENALDTFERIADAFQSDTCMLRPGKSEPMEIDSEERQVMREKRYAEWVEDRKSRARAAIAKAKGETK